MTRVEGGSTLLPLELDRVSFRHRGQLLLEAVSLWLETNGKTVIMGPNGAGKSLVMRLCHGLLRPSSGVIRWHGSLGSDARRARRRQAMVFQRPVLLRRSSLANVMYGLSVQGVARRAARRQALDALQRFGLTALAHRPARVLSGGEQQRLALARAWALRPEVLFLDEPTAALDSAAVKAVEEAVEAFHADGTRIVTTTHDLGQARRLGDMIVFMCGGRVLEHTPAHAFFDSPRSEQAGAFLRGELVW